LLLRLARPRPAVLEAENLEYQLERSTDMIVLASWVLRLTSFHALIHLRCLEIDLRMVSGRHIVWETWTAMYADRFDFGWISSHGVAFNDL
jgi:hypothetical protein